MSYEKPSCQVVLFPLCDPRGALSEILNGPATSGTRLNALILAWRLELPEGVNMSASAAALLTVAAAQPRDHWSERQLRLVAELRRITESRGGAGRARAEWQRLLKRGEAGTKSKQRKTRTERVFTKTDS